MKIGAWVSVIPEGPDMDARIGAVAQQPISRATLEDVRGLMIEIENDVYQCGVMGNTDEARLLRLFELRMSIVRRVGLFD